MSYPNYLDFRGLLYKIPAEQTASDFFDNFIKERYFVPKTSYLYTTAKAVDGRMIFTAKEHWLEKEILQRSFPRTVFITENGVEIEFKKVNESSPAACLGLSAHIPTNMIPVWDEENQSAEDIDCITLEPIKLVRPEEERKNVLLVFRDKFSVTGSRTKVHRFVSDTILPMFPSFAAKGYAVKHVKTGDTGTFYWRISEGFDQEEHDSGTYTVPGFPRIEDRVQNVLNHVLDYRGDEYPVTIVNNDSDYYRHLVDEFFMYLLPLHHGNPVGIDPRIYGDEYPQIVVKNLVLISYDPESDTIHWDVKTDEPYGTTSLPSRYLLNPNDDADVDFFPFPITMPLDKVPEFFGLDPEEWEIYQIDDLYNNGGKNYCLVHR